MINSKESNNLSFFQESPHLNSPVSFHEARESCNLYLLIGLKTGQTLLLLLSVQPSFSLS